MPTGTGAAPSHLTTGHPSSTSGESMEGSNERQRSNPKNPLLLQMPQAHPPLEASADSRREKALHDRRLHPVHQLHSDFTLTGRGTWKS
ncbi:MAG: hypothetical protein KME15_20220 [Drouetiella hepatica Uher 2000/2452]|uniref:Uncharacterized protein n=1 Tax=Drouetiella hepatica Uher 2000/2452 TaxID=904376 RepID=A0A951UPN5_9CYAN|nr:hypothetical protein [Drouetiella hepatica Uher 2000/2452]